MTLITSLLNLIQELETSEITTHSNSEQKKKKKEKNFTYCSLGGTSGGAINKGYVEKDRRNSFVVSKNDIINLVKACDSETTCIKYLPLLSNNDRRNMAGCHGNQLDIIFNLFVI